MCVETLLLFVIYQSQSKETYKKYIEIRNTRINIDFKPYTNNCWHIITEEKKKPGKEIKT